MLEQRQRKQTRRQTRSNKITSFDRNIQNLTYHQPVWSTTSSICRLCQKDTEDYVHFLLKCDTLSTIRNNHLVRLALYLEKIQVNTDYLVNSEKDLLQLIINCSASNLIDSQYAKDVDTICRDINYTVHVKRAELLLE